MSAGAAGLRLETDAPYTATMVMTVEDVDPKTGAVKELEYAHAAGAGCGGADSDRDEWAAAWARRPSGAGTAGRGDRSSVALQLALDGAVGRQRGSRRRWCDARR